MKFKNIIFTLLFTVMLFSCGTTDKKNFEEEKIIHFKTYNLEELQNDFNEFRKVITLNHPMLYTDKEQINDLFNSQYEKIQDGMEELEFYRLLKPIISSLNCGHTNIRMSQEYRDSIMSKECFIPIEIRIIDNKIYLLQDISSQIPAGAEIISINGRKSIDIIDTLIQNLPADGYNETFKIKYINSYFCYLYFEIIDSSPQFFVEYKVKSESDISNTILTAQNEDQIQKEIMQNNKNRVDNNQLYYSDFNDDYALLKIRSFNFYYNENEAEYMKFVDFIDNFFLKVSQTNITDIILDLRGNSGGDPYCAANIFTYLINEPAAYFSEDTPMYTKLKTAIAPVEPTFEGNLYTLIDGNSFSTTGHLASLLKYHNIGTFIGEESGGSFVCSDMSRNGELSNTKIYYRYSTKAFKTAVSGLIPGRGVIPDFQITPSIDDLLKNKDLEMELAIKLILDRNEKDN